jgi:hypothetical protein
MFGRPCPDKIIEAMSQGCAEIGEGEKFVEKTI